MTCQNNSSENPPERKIRHNEQPQDIPITVTIMNEDVPMAVTVWVSLDMARHIDQIPQLRQIFEQSITEMIRMEQILMRILQNEFDQSSI